MPQPKIRFAPMQSIVVRATAMAGALVALASCKAPDFLPADSSGTTGTTGTGNTTVSSIKVNPCSVTGTLTLAVAATARVDCTNGGTTVTVAGNGASYLVIPEFPTDNAANSDVLYNVAAATTTASASVASARMSRLLTGQAPGVSLAGARSHAFQQHAYSVLRAKERSLAAAGRFQQTSAHFRAASATRTAHVSYAVATPPVGSVRSFHVLSSFSGNGTWKNVGAQLAYAGTDVLLYIDTLAPTNGFTATQLQQFGQYFDQTLYPIDTAAFGPPSDVDNNGHVIMLMSPVVNADTPTSTCQTQGYVAGFFDSQDFDGATDPYSNQGEIFYSIVPDPSATVSCSHTVTDVGLNVPATFLHELQHLIDFSTHVIVHGGQPEAGWLDEGLSINAEELGSLYYEVKCPPPACRTDPSQIFPDSSQGFVNGFMYDSYEYGLLPDTASVTLHSDSDDGFAWRGGDWALVHYIGDQFGHGVWRKLENGTATGVANIVAATGVAFPNMFSDFSLALYTDSLPGLPRTTAPAIDRFANRNLRQMWARLYQNYGPATDIPYAFPIQVFPISADTTSYIMIPGTTSYYRLDTPASAATVTIQFSGPGARPLLPSLNPQLAIFRLPSGQ